LLAAILVALASVGAPWLTAADVPAAAQGGLTEESLGNMLQAMGIESKKVEKRYDFSFKAVLNKEEWDLSMTAVLSQDGKSIWVMAWLDELPRSAADVPRTALLRLLADNDRMGTGKFFAYVATNRRFVLQRVIPNRDITTATMREVLQDLGATVVETYPHWAVENWKRAETTVQNEGNAGAGGKPESGTETQQPGNAPSRAASAAGDFKAPIRK
jgi:hypothetical protein